MSDWMEEHVTDSSSVEREQKRLRAEVDQVRRKI